MTVPRLPLALLLAAALLAGCGADETDEAGAPEPPVTGTAPVDTGPVEEPAERQRCESEQGYTVEFPGDWHTNEPDAPAPACTFFDPDPLDVPEATEFFGAAVTVSREPVAAEEIVEGPDPSREVLSREETEVAGQRAFRIEAESTGEGLFDAGVRSYQVIVVVDGESLILSTYDFEDQDYERNREVVDEMAASLELTGS